MCVAEAPPGEGWISTVIHLANVPLSAIVQPGMAIVHWANLARGRGEGGEILGLDMLAFGMGWDSMVPIYQIW